MPVKRVLLTLGEVKEIVAKKYNIKDYDIAVYNNKILSIGNETHGEDIEDDDYYILQLDIDSPS